MRKPRDFDAELKALEDKARELRIRKVRQLGELVIAAGADALNPDELTGALVEAMHAADDAKRARWAQTGAAMFRRKSRRSARADNGNDGGAGPQSGGAQSSSGGQGAA